MIRNYGEIRFQNCIELNIEEDNINLGAWILLNHPNFFCGSNKARKRYAFWLLNTITITLMHGLFIMMFNVESLAEIVSPWEQFQIIKEKGKAYTYTKWIEQVNQNFSKNQTGDQSIPKIKDIEISVDRYDKLSSPFRYVLFYSLSLIVLIHVSNQMKERVRLIFLIC